MRNPAHSKQRKVIIKAASDKSSKNPGHRRRQKESKVAEIQSGSWRWKSVKAGELIPDVSRWKDGHRTSRSEENGEDPNQKA